MNELAMFIGAHPDDVEAFASGTLQLLQTRGFGAHILVATDGGAGSRLPREEVFKIRSAEGKQAAEFLGASYNNLRWRDGEIDPTSDNIRALAVEIRKHSPSLIFTHPQHDNTLDHQKLSGMVMDAAIRARLVNAIDMEAPVLAEQVALYHWDRQGLLDDRRQFAVATTLVALPEDVLERKLMAFGMHASMIHPSTIERARLWAQIRGEQLRSDAAGVVPFAEGFNQVHGEWYSPHNKLGDILGRPPVYQLRG
jgi:LmbE family N-acetylglucosaminyl deacetylase